MTAEQVSNQIIGVCTYCGEMKPLTDDHVPPRLLFPQPYPINMWTVPACYDCNQSFQKDDEYFRVWLTIANRNKGRASREKLLGKVIRGLHRPQSQRLLLSLYNQSRLVDVVSSGGIHLMGQPAIDFEGSRISRAVERIVKGLFFRVIGYRLPDEQEIRVTPPALLWGIPMTPGTELTVRTLIAKTEAQPLKKLGDTFAFKWLQVPGAPDRALWLLYFYDRLDFICQTCPKGARTRRPAGSTSVQW